MLCLIDILLYSFKNQYAYTVHYAIIITIDIEFYLYLFIPLCFVALSFLFRSTKTELLLLKIKGIELSFKDLINQNGEIRFFGLLCFLCL